MKKNKRTGKLKRKKKESMCILCTFEGTTLYHPELEERETFNWIELREPFHYLDSI